MDQGKDEAKLLSVAAGHAPNPKSGFESQALAEFQATGDDVFPTNFREEVESGERCQPRIKLSIGAEVPDSSLEFDTLLPAGMPQCLKLPAISLQEAHQKPQRGGFTGTVGTQQTENLTSLYSEIEIVKGCSLSKAFVDGLEAYGGVREGYHREEESLPGQQKKSSWLESGQRQSRGRIPEAGQNLPTMSKSKKKQKSPKTEAPTAETSTEKKPSKKRKGRKPSGEAKQNVLLRKHVRKLRRELEAKNAVLELYADHRNWVKPEDMRERLDIPEADRSGKKIESPTQCFVGARYPWEPALKILIGMPGGSKDSESAEIDIDTDEESD